jgi:hypothetical protein
VVLIFVGETAIFGGVFARDFDNGAIFLRVVEMQPVEDGKSTFLNEHKNWVAC